MRLAIHQPNYIPWCGYFAKMRSCDTFVFLDDVEIPMGRSYVHRTLVRGKQGTLWLSVPTSRSAHMLISTVGLADPNWPNKHLTTLRTNYSRCPHFADVYALLAPIYQEPGEKLATFNIRLIKAISIYLQIPCQLRISSELQPTGTADERLISLAQILKADTYVSGKGGQKYQDPAKFKNNGIQLEVHEYRPVPYSQIHGAFIPSLSIVDALFHLGQDTVQLLDYPRIGDHQSLLGESGEAAID